MMVAAALDGDVNAAISARERVIQRWANTMDPLDLALVDAITAHLLSPDHPVAIEAARSAEGFFTESGFKAYLDIYEDSFTRYRSDTGELAV